MARNNGTKKGSKESQAKEVSNRPRGDEPGSADEGGRRSTATPQECWTPLCTTDTGPPPLIRLLEGSPLERRRYHGGMDCTGTVRGRRGALGIFSTEAHFA